MIKYTLELSIKNQIETRIIEADGVIQDETGFAVFYKKIMSNGDGDKESKVIIRYNPAFIVSMVSDDTPRPIQ